MVSVASQKGACSSMADPTPLPLPFFYSTWQKEAAAGRGAVLPGGSLGSKESTKALSSGNVRWG